MEATPRVTLGIATYNRDTYLAEAIESCLGQDYASLEVLVVIDGSNNPRIDQIVSSYADNPRFRVVRTRAQPGDRSWVQQLHIAGPGRADRHARRRRCLHA